MAAINPLNANQQTSYAPTKPELTSLQAKCFQVIAESLPEYIDSDCSNPCKVKYLKDNPRGIPTRGLPISGVDNLKITFPYSLKVQLEKIITAVTEGGVDAKRDGTLDMLIKEEEELLNNYVSDASSQDKLSQLEAEIRRHQGIYILHLCKQISSDLEKPEIPYDPKKLKENFMYLLKKSFELVDKFKQENIATSKEGHIKCFRQFLMTFQTEMDETSQCLGSWSFDTRHQDKNEDWYVFVRSHTLPPFFTQQHGLKQWIAGLQSTEPFQDDFEWQTGGDGRSLFENEVYWYNPHPKYVRNSKRTLELFTAVVHCHCPIDRISGVKEINYSRRAEKLQNIYYEIHRQLTRDEIRNYIKTEKLPDDVVNMTRTEPVTSVLPQPEPEEGGLRGIVDRVLSFFRG